MHSCCKQRPTSAKDLADYSGPVFANGPHKMHMAKTLIIRFHNFFFLLFLTINIGTIWYIFLF